MTMCFPVKTVIEQPPKPANQTMKFNSLVTYACGAKTDPNESIKYTWYKDGKPLVFNSRITRDPVTNGIKIERTQASDSGTYTCEASSGLDSDRKDVTLAIIGESKCCDGQNIFWSHDFWLFCV